MKKLSIILGLAMVLGFMSGPAFSQPAIEFKIAGGYETEWTLDPATVPPGSVSVELWLTGVDSMTADLQGITVNLTSDDTMVTLSNVTAISGPWGSFGIVDLGSGDWIGSFTGGPCDTGINTDLALITFDVTASGQLGDSDIEVIFNCGSYQGYFDCNLPVSQCLEGTDGILKIHQESTLIQLSSFTALPSNRTVILKWSTESEIDNAGFNLYRAESEDGECIQINDSIIPAEGSPTEGAEYEFVDHEVKNRKTYYYKLEDIDLNGVLTRHGPVSATPRWIYGIIN
jgi:hypothetical protein